MIFIANAGLPMLPVQGAFMLAALIPVILIEGALLRHRLSTSWLTSIAGSAGANIVSTIVGVPLSWMIMLALQFTTSSLGQGAGIHVHGLAGDMAALFLGAAWLGPAGDSLRWMVPIALAILLIPAYFISVWIEYGFAKWFWTDMTPAVLFPAIRLANRTTYVLMVIVCFVFLLRS
jgi:hypothetical protein